MITIVDIPPILQSYYLLKNVRKRHIHVNNRENMQLIVFKSISVKDDKTDIYIVIYNTNIAGIRE